MKNRWEWAEIVHRLDNTLYELGVCNFVYHELHMYWEEHR